MTVKHPMQFLLIYGLFIAVRSLDYVALAETTFKRIFNWLYVNGTGCGLISFTSLRFSNETEENHKNLSQDCLWAEI
jgi:hypothetical protein